MHIYIYKDIVYKYEWTNYIETKFNDCFMSSFQKGASELGATCKGICSKGLFIAADIFKKTTKSSTCFLHFLLNLHVMFVFFCSDSEKTAVLCWCLSTLLSFKISWIITVDSWFRKPANNLRLVVLKSPLTRVLTPSQGGGQPPTPNWSRRVLELCARRVTSCGRAATRVMAVKTKNEWKMYSPWWQASCFTSFRMKNAFRIFRCLFSCIMLQVFCLTQKTTRIQHTIL